MNTLLLAGLALAQSGFEQPPPPIHDILTTPPTPAVWLSPDGERMVLAERPAMPSIAELAEPEVKVAGIEINPRTNGPARAYAWRGLSVRDLRGEPTEVALPADARIRDTGWSPDGRHLRFTLTESDGISLWVLDVATAEARRLTAPVLNAAYGDPCDWLTADRIACKVVPEGRGPAPEPPEVPQGPLIEQNLGRKAPARTYTNLLQSPHDEALFEHYLASTVELIGLDGSREQLAEPAVVNEVWTSPDGRYLLVSTLHEPWSYHVPASRFPNRTVVLDTAGDEVFEVADLPLADEIPIPFGSVRTGRRTVDWRADRPATLYWVEALDGGDAGQPAEERDAVYQLPAPFDGEPERLWTSELRYGGITWGRDDVALAWEWWYDTRQYRGWILDPSTGDTRLWMDRNYQDAYADPGSPVLAPNEFGRSTIRFDGDALYLEGRGASPEGVYPFLDRLALDDLQAQRLWQAEDPYYERFVDFVDDRRFVTRREASNQPPNYVLRRLGRDRARALTDFEDPAPQLAGLGREVVTYERDDGLQLSATVYTPPGWSESDGPLPTLFWAYPSEFKSRDTAGQVKTSEHRFSRPRGSSVLFLLTQGYAVVANPTMPILGEGDEEPNDTYVEQLVAGAEAAVDMAVDQGVATADQVAIGGHSYGAFTAANLLAHTDLFQAGIARSGAYNRTLTPFGFQAEQRTFWEATDVYMTMSPFTHADAIDEPILLIHGAEDTNAGTYPVQSERLYEALKGLGATARWVVLPAEQHGYRSLEAVGHVHWEMIRWLDRYLEGEGAAEQRAE